jgi:hypothetical protein
MGCLLRSGLVLGWDKVVLCICRYNVWNRYSTCRRPTVALGLKGDHERGTKEREERFGIKAQLQPFNLLHGTLRV